MIRLNEAGFIYGASADRGGLNVLRRIEAFRRLMPWPQGVAADLGCGVGSYTQQIVSCFSRVVAVDILPENLIEVQRAIGNDARVQTLCCSLHELAMASNSVDAAFLIEVLDHVPDIASALQETWRVLKPGGTCYISVPNYLFPMETHPIRVMGTAFHPFWFPFLPWVGPLHRRLATARVFSAWCLSNLCEKAGLRIVRTGAILPPLERRLKSLRPVCRALERTPLRAFGSSLLAVAEKPH